MTSGQRFGTFSCCLAHSFEATHNFMRVFFPWRRAVVFFEALCSGTMCTFIMICYQGSFYPEISLKFLPHQYILLLLQLCAVSICVRSPE